MSSNKDAFDRLEEAAANVAQRAEWEQSNRVGLLWVHGLMGLLAGPQMLLWGSASTIESAVGVWSRVVLAGIGTLGGMFLVAGLRRTPRSIPLEVAGLALVGSWDCLMALGLVFARLHQNDFRVIPLGEPLTAGYVVAYPITVYVGLTALILVHLWTLRRIKKGR